MFYKVAMLQGGLAGDNWVSRVHAGNPTYFTDADGMWGW